jgi:hypothetical protein
MTEGTVSLLMAQKQSTSLKNLELKISHTNTQCAAEMPEVIHRCHQEHKK